jgi:transcriptional regulator with XRE-family HTH domain
MSELGPRVRGMRRQKGWTLDSASTATGLARSTISKIENSQMSPTYDALIKLAQGFAVDISELFEPHAPEPSQATGSGRRSITRAGHGQSLNTPVYLHRLLCNDLSNKLMTPFHSSVTARAFEDFADWDRHAGEELLYVLQGEVELFTEFYEPEHLASGDCAYLDSRMGHRVISRSAEDAQVLWVHAPTAGTSSSPHSILPPA